MMGAGKTTLGRMTAERLGREFLDADVFIESESGMSIPEIFARFGEDEFRRRELSTLRTLLERPGAAILATGGGAFCQPAVREALYGKAATVFIKVSEKELIRRLEQSEIAERPVLSSPDWRQRVKELVLTRYPQYDKASHILEVGDEKPEHTVDRLVAMLS